MHVITMNVNSAHRGVPAGSSVISQPVAMLCGAATSLAVLHHDQESLRISSTGFARKMDWRAPLHFTLCLFLLASNNLSELWAHSFNTT